MKKTMIISIMLMAIIGCEKEQIDEPFSIEGAYLSIMDRWECISCEDGYAKEIYFNSDTTVTMFYNLIGQQPYSQQFTFEIISEGEIVFYSPTVLYNSTYCLMDKNILAFPDGVLYLRK